MHQHTGLRQVGRTILTITGIVLLIIFGMRAASQASNLAAVGGKTKQGIATIPSNMNWLTELATDSTVSEQRFAVATNTSTTNQSGAREEQPHNEIVVLSETAQNLAAKSKQIADVSLEKASEKNDTGEPKQVGTSDLTKYDYDKDSVK